MSFESTLEDAFTNNDAGKITGSLLEEKTSKSLMNRLDKVASKELDRNEFGNISLILRAIEKLCESDEEVVDFFIQQGLVLKISRASEFLKIEELKLSKGLLNLIEEFYDVSMSICRTSLEGKCQIQDIFVLRFGMLVTDADISFGLRLEAVRTINSILDRTTKDERRKLSLSDDHCLLLEEFAKVVLEIGDYEMQVAISEALCRMTVRKWREELVYKWFSNTAFADSFKSINDREFETDCRRFLNEVNSSFGNERRVFTFPCLKAFLDLTELFMPDDENLDKFWIDFNLGTSCISFFVNDPEGELWESINLAKEAVGGYSVVERDDEKILTVHMAVSVSHSKTKGKAVKIIFDSQYDIQNVVKSLFGEPQSKIVHLEGQTLVKHGMLEKFQNPQSVKRESMPSPTGLESVEDGEEPPVAERNQNTSTALQKKTLYNLHEHSDTEVAVTESAVHKEFSHVRKTNSLSFVAALRRFQVMRAKARLFSRSASSDGPAKATSTMGDKRKESQKKASPFASESSHSKLDTSMSLQRQGSSRIDYTRKKPKIKTKLKILPLSSPSSAEEPSFVKRSKLMEGSNLDSFSQHKGLDLKLMPMPIQPDNEGLPGVTELDDSVFLRDEVQDISISKESSSGINQTSPIARKRKFDVTDGPTEMFAGDYDSDTEMGSGVIAAFQTFKNQLSEHFSSRYKKIETRSLESLSECQKSVTSLLNSVHTHRLRHLERFQVMVVNELGNLEKDCHSLKEIERETMDFWKAESQAVAFFCNKQLERLQSLRPLRMNAMSYTSEQGETPASLFEFRKRLDATIACNRDGGIPVKEDDDNNNITTKTSSTIT